MSADAKAVLRGIRTEIDEDGIFRGSVNRAAWLARMSEPDAQRALQELTRAGVIAVRRISTPDC